MILGPCQIFWSIWYVIFFFLRVLLTDIHQTEALECQARCFTIQTGQYAESRQLLNEVVENSPNDEDEDDGGARLDTSTKSVFEDHEMEQRWASVVESVTTDTLLDTILAQLGTLTTLCSILSNNPTTTDAHLNDIELYSNQVNNVALPELLKAEPELATQEHIHDITLAQMNFQLNHTELLFHAGKVNLDEYQQILEEMYNKISAMTMADLNIAFSRGLLTFSNAVGTGPMSDVSAIRWKALSQALKVLADAAKLPGVKEQIDVLALTHLLRGDSSLMLKSLGDHPHSYSQAVTNASQLLKNAQVYYTNAFKLATIDLKDVCEFRRSIVIALLQSGNGSGNSTSGGSESPVGPASSVEQLQPQSKRPSWYFKQLQVSGRSNRPYECLLMHAQDMMEDGLISESFATAISTLIH